MDIPVRHRPIFILLSVILAQLLLLAFQIKRGSNVRLIRVWSVELLTPLERVGNSMLNGIGGVWYGYLDLRHARADNRKLQAEVDSLQLKNQQLEGQAAEAVRLSSLLGFRVANAHVPMLAAEVIGASADPNSLTIFINRGEREGIRRNMAVITPDGVVGKIADVFPHTAQVLLITDRESGVGALFADTRTHGVVKGTGGPQLWMDLVVNDEKVPVGAKILTSGEDRIFPKDLPVGTVASTKPGFPFQTIHLIPAARLDRLEEVLVLFTQEPLHSPQEPTSTISSDEQKPEKSSTSEETAKKDTGSAVERSAAAEPNAKTTTPKSAAPKSPIAKPAAGAKKPSGDGKPSGANPSGTFQ
jgi:rod shape-determining protein MreC